MIWSRTGVTERPGKLTTGYRTINKYLQRNPVTNYDTNVQNLYNRY
jgi:hypothetical protein